MILDWNATAAWLAIFATLAISIITPAISTYLNNLFQLRLKLMDLHHTEESELVLRKIITYEGFLQNVGKFLHHMNLDNKSSLGTYIYEIYLYLPSEHWYLLDSLIDALSNEEWENAQSLFIEISKILSRELDSSKSQLELIKESSPRKYFSNK